MQIESMSRRLAELVEATEIKLGKNGRAKLAIKAEVSPSTLRLMVTKEDHFPERETVFRVALACGCTESEALEFALEASRAKETA